MNEKKCKVLAAEIRLETLKVIHSRGFGHVGGSMDLADLMAVLYGEVMKFDPKNPRWEDRDWLVLSKGHAGPVAYATFGLMGYYPMEEAYTLNHPHTKFPSHTDRKLTPGVDLTTGSLGHVLSERKKRMMSGTSGRSAVRTRNAGYSPKGRTRNAAICFAKQEVAERCMEQ